MGMYDSVWITCPDCGYQIEEQSKVDECILADYTIDNAPPKIIADLNEKSGTCNECGKPYQIVTLIKAFIVYP
ncbi:MAG: hypothetical protein ACW98W_20365 [Candidatus Hodarchaeales archaeon]|jgi:hypothetical protein